MTRRLSSRLVAVVLMVGVGVAAGACRQHALVHGLDSPEAVARAVITALAAHDVEALRKLALTEDEFRGVVWPRLPASRPERNVPWDYAWNDLHAKSSAQLQARVRGWKDRGFDVVRVAFEGETSEYDTFRVRRKSVLTLRDRDGQETRGRLFGSVIEQDGRYKVFSYVVD